MDRKKIEERADKILNAYNYNDGADDYVDAVRLACHFGFAVNETDKMQAQEDGCITVTDKGEMNIIVNNNRNFESKRFIITHELSHYFLHYQNTDNFFMHRENIKGKDLEENDADYLAACLLMPKKSFRVAYGIIKGKYSNEKIAVELQKIFRTPLESIERRIKEIC